MRTRRSLFWTWLTNTTSLNSLLSTDQLAENELDSDRWFLTMNQPMIFADSRPNTEISLDSNLDRKSKKALTTSWIMREHVFDLLNFRAPKLFLTLLEKFTAKSTTPKSKLMFKELGSTSKTLQSELWMQARRARRRWTSTTTATHFVLARACSWPPNSKLRMEHTLAKVQTWPRCLIKWLPANDYTT